jgi:hypothetical protein
MTSTRDPQSLSNIELIVLARLSSSKGATDDELVTAVAEIASPDEPPSAHERAMTALATLRRRALVTVPKPTRRSPAPRSKLTPEGGHALRIAFDLDKKPNWTAVRDRYLPALALGLSTVSEQASKLGNNEELTLAVLRQHFEVPQASTVNALCDTLLAKALGLPPGPLTLPRLRAHVLTHALGLDAKVTSTDELEALAGRVAVRIQGEVNDDKYSLRQALGRRWAYRVRASVPPLAVTPRGSQPALSQLMSSQIAPRVPTAAPQPSSLPVQPAPYPSAQTSTQEPRVVLADTLLTLVREAIPRIGSDGRFGPEKVFVSAIWHHIERDGRLPDLSLDRFKRWLVTFNRDQLLDLARADARGEMDGQLVEESEINDQGATFHFVVDRRAAVPGRGFYAR